MTDVVAIRRLLAQVADPELPVVTIEDLGILREVTVEGDRVVVTVTPTYSGCPAMREIEQDIRDVLARHGHPHVAVRTVLTPAWTTDWISPRGRRALRAAGIAPPLPAGGGPVLVQLRPPGPACPQCGSGDTEELSRFSSTACTSLWRCRSCREPFGHVKAH